MDWIVKGTRIDVGRIILGSALIFVFCSFAGIIPMVGVYLQMGSLILPLFFILIEVGSAIQNDLRPRITIDRGLDSPFEKALFFGLLIVVGLSIAKLTGLI